jgi:acetyl-CoA acyltransferase
MNDPVIVAAVRTAIGKAPNGRLRSTRPDEMAATVLRAALERVPALDPAEIDDVVMGCAMPEAEQGLNVARIASLRAGLPVSASRRSRSPPDASAPARQPSCWPAARNR